VACGPLARPPACLRRLIRCPIWRAIKAWWWLAASALFRAGIIKFVLLASSLVQCSFNVRPFDHLIVVLLVSAPPLHNGSLGDVRQSSRRRAPRSRNSSPIQFNQKFLPRSRKSRASFSSGRSASRSIANERAGEVFTLDERKRRSGARSLFTLVAVVAQRRMVKPNQLQPADRDRDRDRGSDRNRARAFAAAQRALRASAT
jgi:hypothetical protein